MSVIEEQIKSESYESLRTAIFCIQNLITDHQENQQHFLNSELLSLMIEVIDEDEEDEEISNQIYECLLAVGTILISHIMNQLSWSEEHVSSASKNDDFIMIDVVDEKQRFLSLKETDLTHLRT